MDTERIQLARTHDSPFVDKGNQPLHGQPCCCQMRTPKIAAVSEACTDDCSIKLDSRKGRHIKISHINWGTVWGTTVPEHEFFDPKTGLTGRAKFFIPSNRAWDFIRC
jgi:hypothetical protein